MRIDEIQIHTGSVDFDYEPVRELEAKCEAMTNFSKAPTIQDANLKLQQLAAQVGANAVIRVKYDSGISLTSWRSMKATGLAVRRISDEIVCPVCAETIKRAARKCRFCGADLATADGASASSPSRIQSQPRIDAGAQPWASSPHTRHMAPSPISQEPLRSTDNPARWIIIIFVILFVIIALIEASS